MRRAFAVGLLCAALSACTTTRRLSLQYSPSDAGLVGNRPTAPLSMGAVNDRRETPGAPLGTAHSGIGDSTKEIVTSQPLTSVVRQFFVDAIEHRGAYDPSSPEQITVDILDFRANQFIRREVNIDLLVSLRDARTGYTRNVVPVRINRMQGGLLNADNLVIGNYVAFQRFIEQVLSQAADEGVQRATSQ